mmetsp:Transcript_37489/g.80020  ORF Transcript_37489/g.80020 Transcript_37489/m.80020 type:complete len:267 (-) Transcript_37489:572-1372(-)
MNALEIKKKRPNAGGLVEVRFPTKNGFEPPQQFPHEGHLPPPKHNCHRIVVDLAPALFLVVLAIILVAAGIVDHRHRPQPTLPLGHDLVRKVAQRQEHLRHFDLHPLAAPFQLQCLDEGGVLPVFFSDQFLQLFSLLLYRRLFRDIPARAALSASHRSRSAPAAARRAALADRGVVFVLLPLLLHHHPMKLPQVPLHQARPRRRPQISVALPQRPHWRPVLALDQVQPLAHHGVRLDCRAELVQPRGDRVRQEVGDEVLQRVDGLE